MIGAAPDVALSAGSVFGVTSVPLLSASLTAMLPFAFVAPNVAENVMP